MYFNGDLKTTGLNDVQFRFYDAYNKAITDWSGTGVLEEETTGIYYVEVDDEDVSANAISVRWRSESDPSIRTIASIARSRYIRNPRGIIKITEDSFKFRWDTRTLLNGTALVEAYALGSDGLWAIDSATVDINNQLSTNIIYKEFPFELGREGYEIVKSHFGIESYALQGNPLKRGWLQLGVRTEGSELPITFTPEQAETWWKQFRIVPLERGVSWTKVSVEGGSFKLEKTDDIYQSIKSQIHNVSTLDESARKVYYGLKITPYEVMKGFNLRAEKINKIRKYEDDEYFILTKNPAILWSYNGNTLRLIAKLDDYIYNNITFKDSLDATYLDDKIFVVTEDHKLGVIDTTPEERHYIINPTDENKPLKWVERSDDGLIAIYGDNTNTTAYTINDLKPIWELNHKVDFITLQDDRIIFVVGGNTLYVSTNFGLDEPEIEPFSESVEAFPYPIISVYSPVVLLNNGDTYEKTLVDGWKLLGNITSENLTTISYARIGESYQRAFFGQTNNKIIEMFADGSVSDTRELDIVGYDESDYDKVAAMWHYEKELVAAKGTIGSYDYVPPVYDDRLLIATDGPDGEEKALLIVLQKSALDESSGAQLVSAISKPDIFPKEEVKSID